MLVQSHQSRQKRCHLTKELNLPEVLVLLRKKEQESLTTTVDRKAQEDRIVSGVLAIKGLLS